MLAQKEAQSSSFDGKSIAIGFVLGVVLTVAGLFLLWFFRKRVYKKKGRLDASLKKIYFTSIRRTLAPSQRHEQ